MKVYRLDQLCDHVYLSLHVCHLCCAARLNVMQLRRLLALLEASCCCLGQVLPALLTYASMHAAQTVHR